jgi:hypothetical protein
MFTGIKTYSPAHAARNELDRLVGRVIYRKPPEKSGGLVRRPDKEANYETWNL